MVLALQVSEKDVYIGLELVRLICDIEQKVRDDVMFCVSWTRYTNPHAIQQIVQVARNKFRTVFHIPCKRFGKGWPNGCNDLWFETMMRLNMDPRTRHRWALTFEPDCIPMKSNWIDILKQLVELAIIPPKKLAIGHHHGHPKTHMNGNALFNLDIVKKLRLEEGDGVGGWDVWNRKEILANSLDTDEIYQIYRIRHIKPERVAQITKHGKRPALFHGIKGMLGIEGVRWMMANGDFK